MLRILPPLLFAVAFLLRPESAAACSCVPNGPPCQDYWKAAAVFRGRVEAIASEPTSGRDPFPPKLVRFTVLERFVGIDDSEATVSTPGGGGMCGYRFTLNREYIVYAEKGSNGRLMTSICSRTAPVERAAADLEFARNIASGGQPLGLIEGTVNLVTTRDSLWSPTETRSRPVPGVTITLRRGEEESFPATTDRAGRFAVSGLQPGTYRAELKPPDGTRLESVFPETIELLDARGCATFGVELAPDGRIKGRVVDAVGRAVRGLTVGLRQAQAVNRGPALATNFRALTDSDGRFEIAGVPPGRFLLSVESSGPGRMLHPGVVDEGKAERFDLRIGSRLTVKDFTLQDVVTISGVAVDAGRAPIEGARVYLREPFESGGIVTLPVVTDWSGRFVISVPAGQEYVIFAERDRPGATLRTDASEPIGIGPRSPEQPLVLTLRPRY
jgi:hypothetical protein